MEISIKVADHSSYIYCTTERNSKSKEVIYGTLPAITLINPDNLSHLFKMFPFLVNKVKSSKSIHTKETILTAFHGKCLQVYNVELPFEFPRYFFKNHIYILILIISQRKTMSFWCFLWILS